MPEQKTANNYETLIHLGCGANPPIDEYAAIANQVYLIEADDKIADTLKCRTRDLANIHLVQALLDTDERHATFYRYNFAWANSLIPVSPELARLYPGVRLEGKDERQTTSINRLINEYLPAQNSGVENLLVMDLGPQNQKMLQALDANQLLEKLGTIILLSAHRRSEEIVIPPNLYQPDTASIQLTLPNKSCVLQPHPLLQECRRLQLQAEQSTKRAIDSEQQVEELEQGHQKLQQDVDSQERELRAAQAQLKEVGAQLKVQTEKLQKAAEQRDEAIRASEESERNKSKLRNERDELTSQLGNQGLALQKCRDELEAKEAIINAKVEEYAKAVEELRVANKEHNNWQQQALETEKKLDALVEQHHETVQKLEAAQVDFKEQQRSAQLSTKLLAKVEADASELRERYAEKVKSEQELKELIKELHAKLQAASHFYHQLEQEHPELLEKL